MSSENYISIKKYIPGEERTLTNRHVWTLFLVSEDLLTDVSDCKIIPGYRTIIPLYCWISTLVN